MNAKLVPQRDKRGIHLAQECGRRVTLVNPTDRDWRSKHGNNYVLWFGQMGTTYLRVWADALDDALEIAAEWLAENAPGHITPFGGEEHTELLKEACEELGIAFDPQKLCGMIDEQYERVLQKAEADLTYTESGFLQSWEWGIALDNPSRKELLNFVRGE